MEDIAAAPIALDTLPLLEHTAEDYSEGDEDNGKEDAGGWVVVLNGSTTVGTVVPAIIKDFI